MLKQTKELGVINFFILQGSLLYRIISHTSKATTIIMDDEENVYAGNPWNGSFGKLG
jgi:hypothetical protein